MNGRALNRSGQHIDAGVPIAEASDGGAILADLTHPAFAVALLTYDLEQAVAYTTDGIVTRPDWSAVIGVPQLTPNASYFVSGPGMLSTTGQQHIGVARSTNDLRVQVENVLVISDGVSGDIDGGHPDSVYGGLGGFDGGGP